MLSFRSPKMCCIRSSYFHACSLFYRLLQRSHTCSAALGSLCRMAFPISLSLASRAEAKAVEPALFLTVRSRDVWARRRWEHMVFFVLMDTCSPVCPEESCVPYTQQATETLCHRYIHTYIHTYIHIYTGSLVELCVKSERHG